MKKSFHSIGFIPTGTIVQSGRQPTTFGLVAYLYYENVILPLPQCYPRGQGGANITSQIIGKSILYPNSYSSAIHI